MKDVKIAKGKYAVVKRNGKVLTTIQANKKLRIEGGDDMEVEEKTLSKLTKVEKEKMKLQVKKLKNKT